ncbi:type I restriction endonuclease subunit R [Candidatus Poribacteria bacterium]|nr:type I restriction endonuclease subunit R [Candidatus Poribacteria bacterium]
MRNPYSEDSLVEQPTIALFKALGWEVANGFHEFDRAGGSPFGRETKGEVVLVSRLRSALQRLNPKLPRDAIEAAIEELTRNRGAMSLVEANHEVYRLIKDGVKVKVADVDSGDTIETVSVIDWNAPHNNDFFLVSQFWVTGEMYTRRADLVGFVNGLPLVFVELKAVHQRLETAYTNNLTDYKSTIPHLFWYNALIILSNGSRSQVGNVTATWEHFNEWKRFNSERSDVVVIADEAHRSQYDTYAMNMRTALRNAAFIAFTGTPLMVGEEKTRAVFGDYVSIYNFKQSIDDGATVPLYYENRIPELQLTNESLNEDMLRGVEEAELDDAQEWKLEREFAREYHLITRNDRLETIAADIVAHFMGRGHLGKAMVVCIDKATAVKMYDKVQKHWGAYQDALRSKLPTLSESERAAAEAKLRYMEDTDMVVVVSPSQNEIAEMQKKGVDITPHRQRIVNEDLDTKFKDPDDLFRIVFVCAMWMTGFDVPSCSTLYLDKPMRNHTLMQTISRANRVFGDKTNGLIVDYIGVFRDLQKALAIYGSDAGGGIGEGDLPIKDKSALVEPLKQAIASATAFCVERGIDLDAIQAAQGYERIQRIDDAVDAILINDASKQRYLTLTDAAARLYKAILPHTEANELAPICVLLNVLAQKLRSLTPPADISEVTPSVEYLLDASIAPRGYLTTDATEQYTANPLVDLSEIDFDALRASFEKGRKHTQAEKLKVAINAKLAAMVRFNRTRVDYLERFQQLIDEYNVASLNVDTFFDQLVAFVRELNAEEQRTMAEQLSEEELAVFDLLTRPDMQLSADEKGQVKAVAHALLEALKREKLVLDWRKRQQSRAWVRLTIGKILDDGLPACYTKGLYDQKCEVLFQHIYESYSGGGSSIYAVAA